MKHRSWSWIAVVASACGGWTSSDPAHAPAAASTALDQARAYERGTGVARDYRAAAEIYERACDRGHGSLAACHALLHAHIVGRGVDLSPAASRELAGAVCLARRDPYACVAADVLADHKVAMPQPLRDTITDVAGDLAACDVTHPGDCRAQLLTVDGTGASPYGLSDRRRRQLHAAACRVGIVESCAEVLRTRRAGNGEIAEATRQLQTACDAHDAAACAAAPDRTPVPLGERCAASDYQACAQLGCQGDAAARQRAASHGAQDLDCRRFDVQPEVSQSEVTILKMTEFKDRMCACTDKACADLITEDMTQWGREMATHSRERYDRVTEDDTKRIVEVTEQMTKCMTRAMMAP